MGKLLIILGTMLLFIGVILHYVPGVLNWFGKLPGDIRIEDKYGFMLMPITSMILISLVATLLINLFFRK